MCLRLAERSSTASGTGAKGAHGDPWDADPARHGSRQTPMLGIDKAIDPHKRIPSRPPIWEFQAIPRQAMEIHGKAHEAKERSHPRVTLGWLLIYSLTATPSRVPHRLLHLASSLPLHQELRVQAARLTSVCERRRSIGKSVSSGTRALATSPNRYWSANRICICERPVCVIRMANGRQAS